jgi:predicted Fe-Mo cluster-binding NifX family protein
MKVVISATGRDLDATVDERFGRCRYFIIVETDDMSVEAVDNVNADLSTSAGIQSASYVASTGAEAVITGNCGPKAMQVFAETNIRIILGQHGMIKDVLQKFKTALSPSTRENVPEKSGAAVRIEPEFRPARHGRWWRPRHGRRRPMHGRQRKGHGGVAADAWVAAAEAWEWAAAAWAANIKACRRTGSTGSRQCRHVVQGAGTGPVESVRPPN